ncbi:MAG: exonuclease domain-containing protein [Rhodoluna sp.]
MNEQLSFEFTQMPDWSRRLAVFDLETTGLDLKEARIVTACALEIDENGDVVGENFEWLADPGIEIPEAASNVHGVTTEIARASGRAAKEVVAELIATLNGFFAKGLPVVAYNAPYDFTILHFEALRHGLEPIPEPKPIIDPLVIDKFVDTYRSGKRTLEVAAKTYGVSLDDAHNATADAVAAGRVAQAIAKRYADKLPEDLVVLHNSQIEWSASQDASYEKFRRGSAPEFTVKRGWPIKL